LWARPPSAGESSPRTALKVADGLIARFDGRPEKASALLVEGTEELDRLGRHYDAACVALEAAVAADASGRGRDRVGHAHSSGRAARSLGLRQPFLINLSAR
jgi:hypothetical protein